MMMRQNKRSETALDKADTYAEWLDAARVYDKTHKLDLWRATARTNLYDFATIENRLAKLKRFRRNGNDKALLFALNEGIHGNMGGMGKDALYSRAKSGTKLLIHEYIDTICESLQYLADAKANNVDSDETLDFFRRASHCFGRSAAMFSGGGNLIYFHYGVAKALIEEDILPSVISGASAGAMLVGILGTHTQKELLDLIYSGKLNFGDQWKPNRLEKLTGVRRLLGATEINSSFDRLLPNLTFAEAFELSGRHINISVAPVERHQTSRLLNATTSPNVLIRSAVKASCALPGMVDPVTLYAKNENGRTVPYLPARKWQDGSISDDLPAKRLSRLYGVNHYIVSMINPYALEYFRKPALIDAMMQPVTAATKEAVRQGLNAVDRRFKDHKLASMARLMHSLIGQNYKGDINIYLQARHVSPFKLVSPWTHEEVLEMMHLGEKATWPKIEQIRTCAKIGRVLDNILRDHLGGEHTSFEFREEQNLRQAFG